MAVLWGPDESVINSNAAFVTLVTSSKSTLYKARLHPEPQEMRLIQSVRTDVLIYVCINSSRSRNEKIFLT